MSYLYDALGGLANAIEFTVYMTGGVFLYHLTMQQGIIMETKYEVAQRIQRFLLEREIHIVGEDFERPWGGFFVIDDRDRDRFIDTFFPSQAQELKASPHRLSPKILIVAPHEALSLQWHEFRDELHVPLEAPVGYELSTTDEETPYKVYQVGQLVEIPARMRHSLVGLDKVGVVAEIWKHINPDRPSTEEDNNRVRDRYGRV